MDFTKATHVAVAFGATANTGLTDAQRRR